jgi:hypothetical protein
MDERALVEDEWRYVVSLLPPDFEERAFSKFAIRRRRRVAGAEELLRMVLAYSACDFSLRQLAAWARMRGVAELSDVAVFKRLRGASAWLGDLVLAWLAQRGLTRAVPPLSVRVIDASVVMAPGGVGVDWRVHAGLDLAALRLTSVEVTGPEGGETLRRHAFGAGEVVLADRGYAHREAVAGVLKAGAHLVVRGNWQNFPLETRTGGHLDVVASLEALAPGEIGDWPVQFRVGRTIYPLRLVALRKSRSAATREQKKIRSAAQRKRHRPDPRSLRAAHFLYVLTDLPPDLLPAHEALELYRLRWQIELAFKRLKSILNLDRLRAHTPQLATTYLYGKLLTALILDELCASAIAFFPWGYPLVPHTSQSLALADLAD